MRQTLSSVYAWVVAGDTNDKSHQVSYTDYFPEFSSLNVFL